ncbi:ABC transporter ATP-binding protein, partial [Vibrio parahaemolyticus]|uniref:ABC transporter ATP-binding protein n=1 Tax=Vibrio parahaemolyticus TaxID=670 RepID=UPI0004A23D62
MTEYAIQAQNVVKKFGDFTAINNITLNVPKGSIYGFLGPNGCGKSTTIRVLTGLLSPSEGSVDVLGLEIPKQSEQLRLKIGYMTQKFSLYDDLSVQENLEFIGQIFGLSSQSLKERIEEQLTTYGLDQLRKQRVSGMSGGE